MNQTLSQKRARHAWEHIHNQNLGSNSSFSSYTKAFPALIQQDGLLQAVAFYLDKGKEHKDVVTALQNWLKSEHCPVRIPGEGDLCKILSTMDSLRYLHVTREAQEYIYWLKRFVQSGKEQ